MQGLLFRLHNMMSVTGYYAKKDDIRRGFGRSNVDRRHHSGAPQPHLIALPIDPPLGNTNPRLSHASDRLDPSYTRTCTCTRQRPRARPRARTRAQRRSVARTHPLFSGVSRCNACSPARVRGTNLPLSPLPFEPCVGILEATSGRGRGRGPLIQMTDLRNKGVVQ